MVPDIDYSAICIYFYRQIKYWSDLLMEFFIHSWYLHCLTALVRHIRSSESVVFRGHCICPEIPVTRLIWAVDWVHRSSISCSGTSLSITVWGYWTHSSVYVLSFRMWFTYWVFAMICDFFFSSSAWAPLLDSLLGFWWSMCKLSFNRQGTSIGFA